MSPPQSIHPDASGSGGVGGVGGGAVPRQIQRRPRELGGVIRFWPAFGMGVAMSLIAGVLYAVSWEASQAVTGGDFMAAYSNYVLEQARANGESAAAIAKLAAEMAEFKIQYANPWFRLPMVFSEIFPVGVLVSLVSAALLRRPSFLPARRSAAGAAG